MKRQSLVDEDRVGHRGYPGGPVDLNVGVVVHLCEVVAGVPFFAIGVVEGSIIAVIGCVVCEDFIFLRKEKLRILSSVQMEKASPISIDQI